MPLAPVIFMPEKSAYINAMTFLNWLLTQFISQKLLGRMIPILDGYASHCSSIEVLRYAEANNILLCLQTHTNKFLQALDGAF